MRFPRAGELVLQVLEGETFAMLSTARVLLWKGTSVGRVVKAARSLTQQDPTLVFEVEAEGGEVLQVVSHQMAGKDWTWRRV